VGRNLESTISVNLQKEQDKDKRTKMVKEYLTNSVLPRDRAKADKFYILRKNIIFMSSVRWQQGAAHAQTVKGLEGGCLNGHRLIS
jgi:hypothetical protein